MPESMSARLGKLIDEARADLVNSREHAIVVTKLEEAKLWLDHGAIVLAAKAKLNAGMTVNGAAPTI